MLVSSTATISDTPIVINENGENELKIDINTVCMAMTNRTLQIYRFLVPFFPPISEIAHSAIVFSHNVAANSTT